MSALSLIARLRRYVGTLRRALRLPTRLDAHLLLYLHPTGTLADGNLTEEYVSLEGQAQDLSPRGLSLLVPAGGINPDHLKRERCTIKVMMTLPTGRVELLAVPVRYNRIDHEGIKETLFIGVHIIEIGEVDRARFNGYLQMLRD